ncbi:putative NACHT, partial [Triplophysa rosa]
LWRCEITEEGCAALISALISNPSHLTYLHLSDNYLRDSGVKLVSTLLESPRCKLEKLRLWTSNITAEGCDSLASALKSNPTQLTELDLCGNKVGNSGVKLISAVLVNPLCNLRFLGLSQGNITDEGCIALSSALITSHLTHLILSINPLGDSGVKQLSAGLENADCKLEILELMNCNITDEGCTVLASALTSNPAHLRHLDLSKNYKIRDLQPLSDLRDDPRYKLEKL